MRRTIIAFATLTLVAVVVFVSARFFDFIRLQRTYPGRDAESAQNCAEATAGGCEVEPGGCP